MPKEDNYYVYIILCDNNSLYTGITNNLIDRFKKHKTNKGANYTKIYKPVKYLSAWYVKNKSIALSLEHFIKKQNKSKKIDFINKTSLLKKEYSQYKMKNIDIKKVYKNTINKINSNFI